MRSSAATQCCDPQHHDEFLKNCYILFRIALRRITLHRQNLQSSNDTFLEIRSGVAPIAAFSISI